MFLLLARVRLTILSVRIACDPFASGPTFVENNIFGSKQPSPKATDSAMLPGAYGEFQCSDSSLLTS